MRKLKSFDIHLICIFSILCLGYYCYLKYTYIPYIEYHKIIIKDSIISNKFSEDKLKNLISILELKEPNIVLNQCKLETGNYTSDAFKNHNNLFGFMKDNKIRHYNNWKESVIHYAHWQNINYKGEDYYKFLKKINYACDSLYINKLKNFK